ncbi:MAG: aminoacyl-tRNA deacylase [Gemmatimonadales bacterium]
MPITKLKDFLDANGVRYVTISHSKAYTANEVAASAHVPGKSMAKTVMVKVDGRMAMAVLPAAFRVSFDQLRDAIGAREVVLAEEAEFRELFPDCEIGAMPPFGSLYGLPVYVADILGENEEIAFNAGSHTEVIRLAYADFNRLVNPQVLSFALQPV